MCNCNIIKAVSVEQTTGTDETYLTITVPTSVDFSGSCIRIGLFTTIPTSISCARVVVTNGTDSLNVLKCDGDYWRPAQLRCRSVINCRILSDPEHLLIVRGV